MGIFDSLGRGRQGSGSGYGRDQKNQNGPRNPTQMLGMLKSDPMGVVRQAGFNIPKGMNDPQQMVRYLLQSGQIDNGQLQMIQNAVSGRRR